jgi:TPR repeat protein
MSAARLAVACLVALPLVALACAHESNLPPAPPAPAPVSAPSASASGPAHVSSDPIALFQKACDAGSADGCNSLGVAILDKAAARAADKTRAEALLQRACDLGSPAGCVNLGVQVRSQDEVRAIGVLTRACDQSWWEGCFWLGDIYYTGSHEDPPLAAAVLGRACKGGHQRSCAALGILYQSGSGVAKDLKKAMRLFETACDADVAFACAFWANAMASSDTMRDVERARAVFPKGCTDAFPAGCYIFGVACASRLLGDDYVPKAEPLMRQACEHGYADACALLGRWMAGD